MITRSEWAWTLLRGFASLAPLLCVGCSSIIEQIVATPTFSPTPGAYSAAQSVSISDATAGAFIYYTTDGTTPTSSSTPYSGSISVSSSETIRAIATLSGYHTSRIASAAYTIVSTMPGVTPAAAPLFTPPGGTFSTPQTVTISDTTPGAAISYSITNGAPPTGGFTPYTGPITVTSTETIFAQATASGFTTSTLSSAAYTFILPTTATPTISPQSGNYTSSLSVTIADATPGAVISYAITSGPPPTGSFLPYTGPIAVSSAETIFAQATASGFAPSIVTSASYIFTLPSAAMPTISPPGGSYTSPQPVTISDTTPGTAIFYTTDGTTPSINSTPYSGPIIVSSNETVQAIAAASGYSNSAVASAVFTITLSASGVGTWTWMAGSNVVNATGVYGTQGVPAASNIPGARSDAARWVDSSGNLWLFGGQNYNVNATTRPPAVYFNDLWRFNPSTMEWTWISGNKTTDTPGVYGSLRIPSASAIPGSRIASTTWTDTNGNLWLFGGFGSDSNGNLGSMNDLWEFNIQSGEWAWMGGSNTVTMAGVYGTLGVPSTGNIPPGRTAAAGWVDRSGNFWLFGGEPVVSSINFLNDLWKFNPSTGEWTWVSGSNVPQAPGVYGILGVASPNNTPGARFTAVPWIDVSDNLWLFGGLVDNGANHFFNDLWEFSPSIQEWTWNGGSSLFDASGVYGTLSTPATANMPGAREWHTSLTDNSGNFWLFGGQGKDSTPISYGLLNDLWQFNPNTKQWVWLSGRSTTFATGVYGQLGVATTGAVPGARFSTVSWIDTRGNLWIFGGYGLDSNGTMNDLNDLWRYQP